LKEPDEKGSVLKILWERGISIDKLIAEYYSQINNEGCEGLMDRASVEERVRRSMAKFIDPVCNSI
jgi:hypothetical protein